MSKKSPPSPSVPGPAPPPPVSDAAGAATQSDLLAHISHELRTPMDAILGYLELLSDTPLDDNQRAFISAIERAGKGLLDIMDDVLNLSRMDAGKLVLHNQPFAIRDCLDSVSQMLAPSAYRKGLDFIRLIDFDVPFNFIGDPQRIRQILVNLVGNAIKFTETGHIRVTVSATPLDQKRYEVAISVSDTGVGISADDLPKLFEPFSQPARPQGDIAGTGLGLVISKSLCETMDGKIAVQSTAGLGSIFCVTIPLESMEASSMTAGELDNLLATRAVAITGADTEQTRSIADNLRNAGATTRIVSDLQRLAGQISAGECMDELVVAIINAADLTRLHKIQSDWQSARGVVPVLSLVSTVSGHKLQLVADALGGDAIAAHSTSVAISRQIATMLQHTNVTKNALKQQPGPVSRLLAGLQLLVAEDNQFGRDYLQELLTRQGASVEVCSNGNEARQMIGQKQYDLVLMDVRMPHCDGVEAFRALAQSGQPLPPIIGLTAAPEECLRALEAGMTDCLLKPIRPAMLLKYITDHQDQSTPKAPRSLEFIDDEMRDELNRELPQRATELQKAIAGGDLSTALDAAHKINGTAALCGFTRLHATAASIEGLIRQQQLGGLDRLTGPLMSQVNEALATLSKT